MAEKIKARVLEVSGLGKTPLRLTECGMAPLRNGDQVLVQVDVAQALCERHANLKAGDLKEVDGFARGNWEPVKIAPAPTETAKAAGVSVEGKPANKVMAPKTVQTKSAEA